MICGTSTVAALNSELQEGMGKADLSVFPSIDLSQLALGVGGNHDSTS